MSKRERAEKTKGAAEPAKVVKTKEPEESSSIRDVGAFVAELAGLTGPDLLLAIRKALNAPDLFTFGELLEVPAVAALRSSESPEDKRHHHLLLLFAYETCSTYRANQALYGELTEAQERKLRQLSIVSLGARHKRVAYEELKEELQIFDSRELEDLLLDTIYLGLVEGKLDSKNQYVSIDFAIGRDVRQEDLVEIARVLSSWQERATRLVALIDSRVNEARGQLQQDAIDRGRFEARVKEVQEQVAKMSINKRHQKEGGGGGGGGGGPMMAGGMMMRGGRKRGPGRGEADWGDAHDVSE